MLRNPLLECDIRVEECTAPQTELYAVGGGSGPALMDDSWIYGSSIDNIVRTIQSSVPGPAGQVLTVAVQQAHDAGVSRRYLALVLGLLGSLVTASTAMGQLERGLNRLYGVEQDRPTVRKYGLALALALTAGVLGTLAAASLAFGRTIGRSLPRMVTSSTMSASTCRSTPASPSDGSTCSI